MKRTITKKRKKKLTGGIRYPEGKHPEYDSAFAEACNMSPILNSNARNLYNSYSANNPKGGLAELEGNKDRDGYYKHGREWKLAAIPYYENELALINQRFKQWRQEQIESGNVLSPPKKWPESLKILRLKNEAILDVRKKEATFLRDQIERQDKASQKKKAEKMLQFGPITTDFPGSLTSDERRTYSMIDGQNISRTDEGVPFIDESDSPYHGMPLFYYFKMAKRFLEAKGLTIDAIIEERDQIYKQEIKKALKKAESEDVMPTINKISIKKLRNEKLNEISKDDFPDWPDGAKPINELGK